MREKLTKNELDEVHNIQERLDTVRLRIDYAIEEEIATSGDFIELAQKIAYFKDMIDEIDLDARLLDERIDRRQWEEWNEGK